MTDHNTLIYENIVCNMSEGVMTIGPNGMITSLNSAGEKILDRKAEELVGQFFGSQFFEYEENDDFNQLILDAVYDQEAPHEGVVVFFTGKKIRHLHVTTSYLRDGGETVGLIAVMSDISELVEFRDAVKAMKKIERLNKKLTLRNQLLNETFGRFLSDEIVHELLENDGGLSMGGTKRNITIMMSDLRGFTVMSERMEPQKLLAMLNHYLGEMTEIIQKRNGTIIEFIGDGIMAVFGAPIASDTHAADAAAAAVEMEARMDEINRWNQKFSYPHLEMGIGLHSGEVIVGTIGCEKRMKYGAVGNHVNICGRIESYTVGGQILISEKVREQLNGWETIGEIKTVYPKGLNREITLSELLGMGGPYQVSCEHRKEELHSLQHAIPVCFYKIDEKHCSEEFYEGSLTALGASGAILKTKEPLRSCDNVKLKIGSGVYAKVSGPAQTGWRLHFTSIPSEITITEESISQEN